MAVAIKVLAAHLSASPELQRRLEREAKAISQLSHPHICTLHDVGREGEPDFAWEPPRLAFAATDFTDTPGRSYDVSPDGQRLLVVKRARTPARTKIHLVQNWFEKLEQ